MIVILTIYQYINIAMKELIVAIEHNYQFAKFNHQMKAEHLCFRLVQLSLKFIIITL